MPLRGKIGVINEMLKSGEELSIEWQINNFLTLSSTGVDFYDSPEFSFGDEQWFLSVWPSGMTWVSFDYVDLYLFRKTSGPREILDVSVGIKGSNPAEGEKKKTHEFTSKEDGCSWLNFYLRSTLQNHKSSLMPNEVLTITCDVRRQAMNLNSSTYNDVASDQEEPIETEAISERSQSKENQACPLNRHVNVIHCMKTMLKEGRRSDFTLKLGAREWALHKMILESRSPYFAYKFLEEWAESAEGEVTSDDVIKEDALDNVLNFIYTGEVEDVYVEDLCDLYVAAHRCQLEDLKPLCIDAMKENMCQEVVCGALAIAKTYKEDELKKAALDYFVKEAEKIFGTEDWEKLKQKHPEILAEVLEESAKRGGVI